MKNLQSLLEKFASEIETAVRAELIAGLSFGARGAVITKDQLLTSVLPKSRVRMVRLPYARHAVPVGSIVKGAKRAPEEVEKLCQRVLIQLARAPKSNMGQLGAALGVSTRELALPIKKLLASKQLKKRGQKRATRYTAA